MASDKTSGTNTISASGNGTQVATRIIALNGNLAFGSVTVGLTLQRTLTISNSGNSTLTVSGISYPSGLSGNWSGSIGAGSSHDVTVTFSPTAQTSYSGTVTVASDKTSGTNTISASGNGTNVPSTGSLTVTLEPSGARNAGAQWRVDSGTWRSSGFTQSSLSAGQHTVSFSDVSGWTKPANQTVAVVGGQTKSTEGTYMDALRLIAPNGGEYWILNSIHAITWNGPGVGTSVKLKLWQNGTFTGYYLTGVEANDGIYTWKIPSTLAPGSGYKIQIYTPDYVHSYVSDNAFTVMSKELSLTCPNGGDTWPQGSTHAVTWTGPNAGSSVKLKLLRNGTFTGYYLTGVEANDGIYSWKIPDAIAAGSGYKIQVYTPDYTYTDLSDGTFTIVPKSPLNLIDPNGGESWMLDSTHTIYWNGSGLGPSVKLKLRRNGKFTGYYLTGIENNDGKYSWKIPISLSPGSGYTIEIYTPDYSYADVSDSPFTLVAKPLNLTCPNGGDTWPQGSTQSVTWSGPDIGPSVKLKLFRNGTFTGYYLTGVEANDGTYSWKIPNTVAVGSGYKIEVYTSDYEYSDLSDGTFKIVPQSPLNLTDPNGGESWVLDSTHTVYWSGLSGEPSVKLKLWRKGEFTGYFLTGIETNDGNYSWRIPVSLSTGSGYTIEVYTPDYQYSDVSDSPFSLVEKPLNLTCPNSGDTWPQGSTQSVTWSGPDIGPSVKLKLFRNGTFTGYYLTGVEANDGTYSWKIPNAIPAGSGYKVQIYTPDYAYTDLSDGTFTIVPKGLLNLTDPNGGESWAQGSTHTVTWVGSGAGPSVKLKLWRNGKFTGYFLTGIENNDGKYSWKIPGALTAGSGYAMQVYTPDYVYSDFSDSLFAVTSAKGDTFAGKPGISVEDEPEPEEIRLNHSADTSKDMQISLAEFLRVMQFYNANVYHCELETEDGFAPGQDDGESCTASHDSDYNPQDWKIDLPELLRLIQLFDAGGYYACPEQSTEDGFCLSLPE